MNVLIRQAAVGSQACADRKEKEKAQRNFLWTFKNQTNGSES